MGGHEALTDESTHENVTDAPTRTDFVDRQRCVECSVPRRSLQWLCVERLFGHVGTVKLGGKSSWVRLDAMRIEAAVACIGYIDGKHMRFKTGVLRLGV